MEVFQFNVLLGTYFGVHLKKKKFTPTYLSLLAKVKEDQEKVSGVQKLELLPVIACP